MKFFEIISPHAVYNIIGHIKTCWNYTYPTGAALEEAIYRGLKSYYHDVRALGGPNTIVDVVKGNCAFDIKGAKQLGFINRLAANSNTADNVFVEQQLSDGKKIIVKIPRSVLAIVKRPNTDMQNFEGDPLSTLEKSLCEYKFFADTTTARAGCQDLYSIVVLYEEDLDRRLRSIFFTCSQFSIPIMANGRYILSEQNKNTGYIAVDATESVCYKLLRFNNGSVNSYKKFDTSQGILYTWSMDEVDDQCFDQSFIKKHGVITCI
jgi:hypothetical protein